MDVPRKKISLLIEIGFVVLLLQTGFTKVNSLIDSPKILTKDGNLIFETGFNRNISFRLNGNSSLLIDDELDVTHMLFVKKNGRLVSKNTELSAVEEQSLKEMLTEFKALQSDIKGRNGLEIRVRRLTSRGRSSNQVVRRLQGRVLRVETKLDQLASRLEGNNCSSNPCQNGGTCTPIFNGFICKCNQYYEGPTCNLDVDECVLYAGTDLGCQNQAICLNQRNGFACLCPAEWHGKLCNRRKNDCMQASNWEMCGHGVCINANDNLGYRCLCDQGWKNNGKTPECSVDVDECSESHTACVTKCINLPGSFTCAPCEAGLTGNGISCKDIDECAFNNGGCSISPKVPCINTYGSYHCGECPNGWSGDGRRCTPSEVTPIGRNCVNPSVCHPLAKCSEISNSIICSCPDGMVGNGFGANGCVPDTSPCGKKPCLNGGTCIPMGSNFTCACPPNYLAPLCSTPADPCSTNPCRNGGRCHVTANRSFSCQCPSGFKGDRCQTRSVRCGGTLVGEVGRLKYPENAQYDHNSQCAWLIRTNESLVLNITFLAFEIEAATECRFDWLQMNDGRTAASQLIGRFCGTRKPKGGNIITSTHYAYLWFRSDNSTAKEGFELQWSSIPPQCGGLIQVESHGTISSPGSPGNYPKNRDCHWALKAPNSKQIKLVFFSLQIEDHDSCNYDFLKITDAISGTTLVEFCKTSTPAPLLLSSNDINIHFHSDNEGSDGGFQIHYFLESRIPGCGGVFSAKEGEIKAPMTSSIEQISCEYDIKLQTNLTLSIEFLKLELGIDECLEIFDVVPGSEERVLQSKYCGGYEGHPVVIHSRFNAVRINYYGKKGDFTLIYKAKCSLTFDSDTDTITSPNYPKPQTAGEVCSYRIIAPPGNHIQLSFIDFDIKSGWTEDCSLNYIMISDGINANSSGPYCSVSDPPGEYISETNMITILLNTATLNESRGFELKYTMIPIEKEGCGGVYTKLGETIRLPTVDGHYKDNVNCTFVIMAPPSLGISLSFTSFNLEDSPDCHYDYVDIFEEIGGGSMVSLGRFCNSRKPPTIVTHSKMLIITFVSDISEGADGFEAQFDFINTVGYCGDLHSSTGVLTSPDWPLGYPNNFDCIWVVNGPSGSQLELVVNAFDVEESENCTKDYLELRNGGSNSSALIGKYCGTTIPRSIPSFTNQLYVHFHTNGFVTGKGFSMKWDTFSNGCGGKLVGKAGTITSPNYPNSYPHNAACEWFIIAPQGSVLNITFHDIDMEEFLSCTYDYVSVSEVRSVNTKYVKKFCKVEDNQPLVVGASHNRALITFVSDSSNTGKGFLLTYEALCKVTLTDIHGSIESPNHLDPHYREDIDCAWTLKAPKGNHIQFEITNFDNYDGSGSIEVRDGEKIVTIGQAQVYESTTNEIQIIQNNKLVSFYLEYAMVGCIGLFTKPNGEFSSPNYPKSYPNNMECLWEIIAPEVQGIELNILKMDIEQSPNCTKDFLMISSHLDSITPKERHCGSRSETVIVSSHHQYVRFKSDDSHNGVGFQIKYNFTKKNCGGKLSSRNGIIESPNYPNTYSRNEDCEWIINVDEGHTITFIIEDIDLEDSYECQFDYVELYDGEDVDSNQLFKVCGSTTNEVQTNASKALIRFQSDDSSEFKGFKIAYHQNCGGTFKVEEYNNDILKKQHIPTNETCEWRIIADDPSVHVALTITHLHLYPSVAALYPSDESCIDIGGKIYDGVDSMAPLKTKFCKDHPPTILSEGHALTIKVPMNVTSEIGFEYSLMSTYCGSMLSGFSGKFASPYYPSSYPIDIECDWYIYASEGNSIVLTFESLDLEVSDECNNDFVEVRGRDRYGKLLGLFCGNTVPTPIESFEGVWVLFKSDGDNVGQGFLASYNYGYHNELNETKGELKSPRYPAKFESDDPYTYRITMDKSFVVILTIEHMLDVVKPLIQFYDGYSDIGGEIEYGESSVITTNTNILYIKARGGPFHFSWDRLSKEVINENSKAEKQSKLCGKSIVGIGSLGSVFQTPGYPDGYADRLNCSWVFVPDNKATHAVVDLLKVDLEELGGCLADYLTISKSSDMREWMELGKVCKKEETSQLQYEGDPYLRLQFLTDMAINKTGVEARISTRCGSLLTEPRGLINITRAMITSHVEKCDWTIQVRLGRRIRIIFVETLLARYNKTDMCENYFLLRNGLAEDSPFLGKGKYCENDIDEILETTSNKAFIRFVHTNDYFRMKAAFLYEEINNGCSQELVLSEDPMGNSTLIVTTPNYPNIPHPHMECIWKIVAPIHHAIQIDFLDKFDLALGKGPLTELCDQEFVEIHDGGSTMKPLLGTYCGKVKPNSLITSGNIVRLRYFSDIAEPHMGFKAQFSFASCGGSFYDDKGVIISPRNLRYSNSQKKDNLECRYRIEAKEGYYLKINMEVFHFPYSSNCSEVNHVELVELMYENGEENITDSLRLCGDDVAPYYLVETNILDIVYKMTDYFDPNNRFKINYEAVGSRCGSTIKASAGVLMTPDYPNGVRVHTNCIWYLRVPKGRRIKIEFLDFDTGTRDQVPGRSIVGFLPFFGRITFANDFEMQSILLRVKNNPPEVLYSTDNTMAVDAFLLSLNKHRGFKLRFTSAEQSIYCNHIFDLQNGGTFNLIGLNESVYCSYNLKPRPDTTLVMKINHINEVPMGLKSIIFCSFKAPIKIYLHKEQIKRDYLCRNENPAILRLPYPIDLKLNFNSIIVTDTNISFDYRVYQCGGIKSLQKFSNFTVEQPRLLNYSGPLDCAWAIWPDDSYADSDSWDENIQIEIKLNLQLKGKCGDEYLILYEGPTQNSPKMGLYCSEEQNITAVVTKGFFFEYHTLDYDNRSTFSLEIVESSGCGGKLTEPFRPIYFHEQYKNNIECIWEIETQVGFHLSLNVEGRFFIEQSQDCIKDYLLIQEKDLLGNWVDLRKLCGREPPKFINSTSSNMRLIFRSDGDTTADGFFVTFDRTCGGVFYANSIPQIFTSPGYPVSYPPNLNCNYTILPSKGNQVLARILDLKIEYEIAPRACYFDNLTIITYGHHEDKHESVICKGKNKEYQSFKSLTIIFKTDGSSSNEGFQIEYSTSICGGLITSPGSISTPKHHIDNNLPPKSNCFWNITAPDKQKILIKFEEFHFEDNHQCFYDGVEIYKGLLPLDEQMIAKICGNLARELPPILSIPQDTALIRSYSDERDSSKGFKALIYFRPNCDQIIFLDDFNSTYDFNTYAGQYDNNLDCSYIFKTKPDFQLEIQFQSFHMEESEGCVNDYLEVKDGAGTFADLIGRYCAHSIPEKIVSSRNFAFLHLVSDGNVTSSGFSAKISMKPSQCGTTKYHITGKQTLTVSSPKDAQGKYPNNLNCFYIVEANRKVRLSFTKMDIVGSSSNHTCDSDYLKVYGKQDRSLIESGFGTKVVYNGKAGKQDYQNFALEHIYCGNATPSDYYSFDSTVYIKFHTDNENAGSGFSIVATSIQDCFFEQTGVSGRVVIADTTTYCDVVIKAPDNYTLSLFSNYLYFTESECDKNYIEVFDLKTNTSIEKNCGGKNPYTFFSNRSSLLVRLGMDNYYTEYDFTYVASKNGIGCGGDFYSNQGIFASPFYPDHVRENADCRWNIRVPSNNHVFLIFEEFNLGAKTTCSSDYLQILEYDQNGEENVVRQFCGEDRPRAYKSEQSFLTVRYRKSVNHDGTGWMIKFNGVYFNFVVPPHYLIQ